MLIVPVPFFQCCRMMSRINNGRLRVVTDSHVYIFPPPGSPADKQNPVPELKAEFRVLNPAFWVRLFMTSELGFAEAYMYGDVECDDLPAVFKVYFSYFLASSESDLFPAIYVQQKFGWRPHFRRFVSPKHPL